MECGTTNGHKYIYFNLGLVQKKTRKNKLTQHSCSVHVTDKGGRLFRCSLIKPVSVSSAADQTQDIIAACRTKTDSTTNNNRAGCRS